MNLKRKPPMVQLNTRVPAALKDKLEKQAAADSRSLSSYVAKLLSEAVERGRGK